MVVLGLGSTWKMLPIYPLIIQVIWIFQLALYVKYDFAFKYSNL